MEFPGDWRAAAASTLDWWRAAGVDALVDEAPRDWLAKEVAPVTEAAPAAALPATLTEFLAWRASEAAPEGMWRGAAVAASGPDDAELMVLVDCPDQGDREHLLGGAAGMLFDRMLAAMGSSRAAVHLAAVSVKRPVGGRMPAEVATELHAMARHHVGLVRPKRLLLMGDAASRALLAADVVRARGNLHFVDHDNGQTAAVASFHPRWLLDNPARKADAWRDLQRLMGVA